MKLRELYEKMTGDVLAHCPYCDGKVVDLGPKLTIMTPSDPRECTHSHPPTSHRKGEGMNGKVVDLGPKLTIMTPSDPQESAYTPAESVTIYGEAALILLRDMLVEVLPDTGKEKG